MSDATDVPRYSPNGQRRLIEPLCEFGHKYQAMECPSCSERLGHGPSLPEHWDWYRKRTNRKVPGQRATGAVTS